MNKRKKIDILVIEDDRVDQMALKRFLREAKLPYNCTFTSTISEAREILKSKRFDLILSDYSIGNGTAFDIMDLREDMPLVMVTGTGNEEVAVQALKRGVSDYLIKDVDSNYLKVLAPTVERTIQRTEEAKALRMLSHAIRNVDDSVFITDMNNKILFVNEAFCKTYGYKEEDIIGKDGRVLGEIDRDGEFYHKRKDGDEFPIDLTVSVLKDEKDQKVAIVRIAHNITERKRMEEELRRLATTDPLTMAYNRTKFNEIISREIERVKRYGQRLSMIIFDIDHFKRVNDTHGHMVGDEVLRTIADLVRNNIRKIEYLIRWGGEEFMILASEIALDEAVALAERIKGVIENHRFDDVGQVTISCGVTEFKEGDSVDTFIKRADDALYMAKKKGKNRVEVIA
jgi:diguanylate cyclase (GGDEF)-like protein